MGLLFSMGRASYWRQQFNCSSSIHSKIKGNTSCLALKLDMFQKHANNCQKSTIMTTSILIGGYYYSQDTLHCKMRGHYVCNFEFVMTLMQFGFHLGV
jgi:hypothetical protein